MRLLLFLLLLLPAIGVYSQGDTLLLSKINELTRQFEDYEYNELTFEDTALTIIRDISLVENLSNYPDRSSYLDKRAEQLRNDLGLNIVGGYVENFNLDPVQDIEENISYRRRVQLGMQWDVLDGGYFENRVRAQMIEDQAQRVKLANDIEKENHYYLARFDRTIFVFNHFKLQILERRATELRKQQAIVRELVYLKKMKREELILMDIRLSEVESLINIYKSYNDYLGFADEMGQYHIEDFPLIDLKYEFIFKSVGIQTDSLFGSADYVQYLKWYHQVGLRPFVRYNYYDMAVSQDRSYFSAGVNFTVPLNFDTDLNNQVEQERWRYENDRFLYERAKVTEDILNTAYDFRYQMKRFVDGYQRRKLTNERLRVERAKLRLSQTAIDPIQGLKLCDELLASDIDLMESLQGLYLKALKIHSKIPNVPIDNIIERKRIYEKSGNVSKLKRDIYVWSKTFEQYTGEFLAEYAIYNEFEKMIVSVSDAENFRQKKLFMQYAAENSEVYFMLGNNKLFYNKDIQGYLKDVLENYPQVKPKGIHLDIEPHTFDDWETNREQLLNEYVSLVTNARAFCDSNDLKLEISVPKHYDEPIMMQLFEIVDKVYFMCYENVDTDFLVRKLHPYVLSHKDKVVIALRTEDFTGRIGMEDKIDQLQKELGVSEFAYHDLQRLISFDKQEK